MTSGDDPTLYPYVRAADQDALTPVRHKVVVAGAGPVGLVAAIDLALRGVPVLVLAASTETSAGSRALSFARRTLEILARLGCGAALAQAALPWSVGRVYFGTREVCAVEFLAEGGHGHPAFVNLPQSRLEEILLGRLRALAASGAPVSLRGGNRIAAVGVHPDHVRLEIDTPEGPYSLEADWLVACDGAHSPLRRMLALDFPGRSFDDAFLVADVEMQLEAPAERRFWFDPPFNPGGSALLHRQPDDIWRIELQLGPDADRAAEARPDRAIPRLRAMLGSAQAFRLVWASVYTFQCRRMERFVHGRVVFAGDAAHQMSPFGARGANSGIQDADNLGWKLAMVCDGRAPATLLESYNWERICAADENIVASARASEFITPASAVSRLFRDAVLDLAARHAFARPLVNSGRLSVPCVYDDGPLNGADDPRLPARTRPGAAACDAPLGDGWLLDALQGDFGLLALGCTPPETALPVLRPGADAGAELAERYLGAAAGALYLLRPDRHVAARWPADALPDAAALAAAEVRARGAATEGRA